MKQQTIVTVNKHDLHLLKEGNPWMVTVRGEDIIFEYERKNAGQGVTEKLRQVFQTETKKMHTSAIFALCPDYSKSSVRTALTRLRMTGEIKRISNSTYQKADAK